MPENKSSESYNLDRVSVHWWVGRAGVCAVGPGCIALLKALSLSRPGFHLKLLGLPTTQMRLVGVRSTQGETQMDMAHGPSVPWCLTFLSVGISGVSHLTCDSGCEKASPVEPA